MKLFTNLHHHYKEHPLSIKVLAYILLCSSIFTLFLSAVQLYTDYDQDLDAIEERLLQIENSYLGTIASSLWVFDDVQLFHQLEGITQLPDISYVELLSSTGETYHRGTIPESNSLGRLFSLHNNTEVIGQLKVTATLEHVYERLWIKGRLIVVSQMLKTFFISLLIMFIIHQLITRHLTQMRQYALTLNTDNLDTELNLKRTEPSHEDELQSVSNALNSMRESLKADIIQREETEKELQQLNEELEDRVKARTYDLEATNQELTKTLSELKVTQGQLVQSEKMASLAELVAGIAHEINTPVGLCVTSVTHLQEKNKILSEKFDTGTLAKSDLVTHQQLSEECLKIINDNLSRAAKLISSFKEIAVDQCIDDRRVINVKDYLQEIIDTLGPKLKTTLLKVNIDCDPGYVLDSYPGAISQIFTNLVLNTVIHGFPEKKEGFINIGVSLRDDYLLFTYKDTGVGLSSEIAEKIFNPFFTTKRGEGGSGLGMHVVYNLITQLLQGSIRCLTEEDGTGASFEIFVPLQLTS